MSVPQPNDDTGFILPGDPANSVVDISRAVVPIRAVAVLDGPPPEPEAEEDRPRVLIPSKAEFGRDNFLERDDLNAFAAEVIERHKERFRHLTGLKVDILWKRKGGQSGGMIVLGKCVKASGLARHYGRRDFTIWLAADYGAIFELTVPDQDGWLPKLEALIAHECCHIGLNEKGLPTSVAHDFEGFVWEYETFGPWRKNLEHMAEAVRKYQLEMDLEKEIDDEEEADDADGDEV